MFFDLTMGPVGALMRPGAFSGAGIAAKGKSTDASDEELLQRYRGGDSDAFRVLYGRHREHLYRFVLRLTANSAEGEEVFQETWMAVIHGRERFRADARFATYLFSIARKRAADRWRKRGTVVVEPLPEIEQPILDEELIAIYGPLDCAHNIALRDALFAAIDSLPPLVSSLGCEGASPRIYPTSSAPTDLEQQGNSSAFMPIGAEADFAPASFGCNQQRETP